MLLSMESGGPGLLSAMLTHPLWPCPPGGGDRWSRQVPLRVPPLLLQEVLGPACWARQQRELPRAGPGWRGLGCQEALCPSASPTAQLYQLRGPGACRLLPQAGLSETGRGAGTAVPNGHCPGQAPPLVTAFFSSLGCRDASAQTGASTCLVVKV